MARLTGLTRTSVSDVVSELIRADMVEEVGRGPSSGGKAPILLSVNPNARHVIGIDLGADSFSGAVVDLRGRVLHTAIEPSQDRDGEAALRLLFALIDDLMAFDGLRPLLGIGIGTPGLIDSGRGVVRSAVHLGWTDVALGSLVGERYGTPVIVANDSQAAALRELAFVGGSSRPNLVVIRVGRGVGAGIILDGRLFQGDGFGAGEIGHTTAVPAGEECRCGRAGCLETVASLSAMARAAGRLDPTLADEHALAEAIRGGHEGARQVVREAGRRLGVAIGGLIGALNVTRVVLVGPAAALGEEWLAAVREAAADSALPLLANETHIELGHSTEDGVMLGASALVMTRQLGLGSVR